MERIKYQLEVDLKSAKVSAIIGGFSLYAIEAASSCDADGCARTNLFLEMAPILFIPVFCGVMLIYLLIVMLALGWSLNKYALLNVITFAAGSFFGPAMVRLAYGMWVNSVDVSDVLNNKYIYLGIMSSVMAGVYWALSRPAPYVDYTPMVPSGKSN